MIAPERLEVPGYIVGLSGYPTAGKDAFADILVRNHGWIKMAWADPLRELALVINPILFIYGVFPVRLKTLVNRLGWSGAKKHSAVRRLLQTLGTEAIRQHLGEDAFIRCRTKEIDDLLYMGRKVVITDCRFPNECHFIKSRDGLVAKVLRTGVGPVNNHYADSGHAMQMANMTIENYWDLETLEDMASEFDAAIASDMLTQVIGVSNFNSLVEYSVEKAYDLIAECSMPIGVRLSDYKTRNNIRLEMDEEADAAGSILINEEVAGTVEYEDGSLFIEICLARR